MILSLEEEGELYNAVVRASGDGDGRDGCV